MPQRKQLTWTELRVGLFVLAGIVLLVLGIFYITGAGALGAKYRLVTYLPEVEGLAIGAPVTLDGVPAGNVDTISVATGAQGDNRQRSVEVTMQVSRDFQQYIRTDSTASLYTQGFLGTRVVSVQRGYTGTVLRDGQEVPGVAEKGSQQIMEQGADLMQNLNKLSTQISSVVTGIQQGQGTIGKLMQDPNLYNRLNNVVGRLDQMTASIQKGQGTAGKLIASDELYNKINSTAGKMDDVFTAIQQQKGSLGKFVYDPSLHDNLNRFLTNGNGFLGDIRAGRGSLGKLATDDTFFTEWKQVGTNLKNATGDLNSTNSTAGKFFTDPRLYDNMTGLAGDLRLLVGDFRKDPRKFLHVKFSLF